MLDDNSIIKLLKDNNPFLSAVSSTPFENSAPDLESLNRDASDEIEQLIRYKRREPSMPLAGLIIGEAGSGKTHMITRILRRLKKSRAINAILITARAFIDYESVTYDLLSEILISLSQKISPDKTQFDILGSAIMNSYKEHRLSEGFTDITKIKNMSAYMQRDMPGLDKDVLKCVVPYAAKDEDTKFLLREWLRGELEDEESLKLGLPSCYVDSSISSAKRENRARKILLSLGLLFSYAKMPMILCFDQLDGMKQPELISAWGNIVHLVMNDLAGILPLFFVKSGIWNEVLRPKLDASVYQRLESHTIIMKECTIEQAQHLIYYRIASAFKQKQKADEIYQWLIKRVNLTHGCPPRVVIELANNAIYKPVEPTGPDTKSKQGNRDNDDSKILRTLQEIYDDECKKVRKDSRNWPPNTKLLTLSLGMLLSSHDIKLAKGFERSHLKFSGTHNGEKLAFFIVTEKTHTSYLNSLGRALSMCNECKCFFISETQTCKKSWRKTIERMKEFESIGGKVILLDSKERVKWYGLASVINIVQNGDVNLYLSSGNRPANLDDIKIFAKDLDLLNFMSEPENNDEASEIINALIPIINASPMKIIAVGKALELLSKRKIKISQDELLKILRLDKKIRLYNSGDEELISLADKK